MEQLIRDIETLASDKTRLAPRLKLRRILFAIDNYRAESAKGVPFPPSAKDIYPADRPEIFG